MICDRRLIRAEPSFGLMTKLWQVSWPYVLMLCALAGVGYVALYSAAGGSPEPYAAKHILRFAFALGISTLIDLLVFFFFTKPMVTWLARFRFFSQGHKLSGLSPDHVGITSIGAAAPAEVVAVR